MTNTATNTGRVPDGTGLSSPTEPSSTVSALTGFDPSRISAEAMNDLYAAIEREKRAERECPVTRGKYRYEPCPKCGATPKDTCQPVNLANWAIARAARAIAT